jgi:hypothetical protein
MYYRYVRGMEGPNGAPDGPEFSSGDDDLAYVFPSDDGFACVAISFNLADYAVARTRAGAAFDERIAAHPFIADRVARATPVGRLCGCGPRDAVVRHPVGPGWALVGDASMHQDPWTGNGMDFASTHAGTSPRRSTMCSPVVPPSRTRGATTTGDATTTVCLAGARPASSART